MTNDFHEAVHAAKDIYKEARAAYNKLAVDNPELPDEFGSFYQGFISGATWAATKRLTGSSRELLRPSKK